MFLRGKTPQRTHVMCLHVLNVVTFKKILVPIAKNGTQLDCPVPYQRTL